MNTETETLVNVIKSRLEEMTKEERKAIFTQIMEGYCEYCGRKGESYYCICNDSEQYLTKKLSRKACTQTEA